MSAPTKPIPYRGATYSSTDAPFLAWWKATMPTALFGEARDAYDKRGDDTPKLTYPFRSFYTYGKGHHDVQAATSLQARDLAAQHWQRLHPRRKIKGDDVTVLRLDVTHSTAGVG